MKIMYSILHNKSQKLKMAATLKRPEDDELSGVKVKLFIVSGFPFKRSHTIGLTII